MLRQDGNGNYYLEFDGVDDFLTATAPVASLGGNLSKTLVVALRLTTSGMVFGYGNASSAALFGMIAQSATNRRLSQWGTGGDLDANTVDGTLAPEVWRGTKNALNFSQHRNGVLLNQATLGAANVTANVLTIGRLPGFSAFFSGRIYGVIFREGLPDVAKGEAWLAAKAGVAL
jgi:hypothetical protein